MYVMITMVIPRLVLGQPKNAPHPKKLNTIALSHSERTPSSTTDTRLDSFAEVVPHAFRACSQAHVLAFCQRGTCSEFFIMFILCALNNIKII